MTFGFLPPFAHLGVPETVRMTSWSFCCARANGLVDVVELVRRVERVGRRSAGRVFEARFHWTSSRMTDAFVLRRAPRRAPGDVRDGISPAEARIVVESDPHALGRERVGATHPPASDGQSNDEADDASHEHTPEKAADGPRTSSGHPSGCCMRLVLATPAPDRGSTAVRLTARDARPFGKGSSCFSILKIPVLYLAIVVWYAVRAEPQAGVRR